MKYIFLFFTILNLFLINNIFALDNSIKEKYESGIIPFLDVKESDWFMTPVYFLKEKNWISGYKDTDGNLTGLFKPAGLITKAEITKIAFNMANKTIDLSLTPQNNLAQNHWAKHFIANAEKEDLYLWKTEPNPNDKASRAETLRLIFEILKYEPSHYELSDFPDVDISDVYFPYIQEAKNLKIISGYPDGTFKPNDEISRAEIAKIIQNSFDILKNNKNNFTETITTASTKILTDLQLKQYQDYAVPYESDIFDFEMKIPGFFQFTSFDPKENEIMRFGFSREKIITESNIDFWLKIIGAETPITKNIQKKIYNQIILEFPREEFSRSFFRIEGGSEFLEMMNYVKDNIKYKKPKQIIIPESFPPQIEVPNEILENIESNTTDKCSDGTIIKDSSNLAYCVRTTLDMGSSCQKGSDCESGYCMAPQDNSLTGACYGQTPLVSCVMIINDGVVNEICE
jgi:hypothetical protein